MCSSMEPGVPFKVDFEWLGKQGVFQEEMRLCLGLGSWLDSQGSSELWGEIPEAETRQRESLDTGNGEEKIYHNSGLLFSCSSSQSTPTDILSWFCLSMMGSSNPCGSAVLRWDYTINKLGHHWWQVPLKDLFIFLCIAFGTRIF